MLDGLNPPDPAAQPVFLILGTCRAKGGLPRYYFQVGTEIRWYRGWEVGSVPFLMDLYQNHDHWRSLFPKTGEWRINQHRAREHFLRLMAIAGPYDPPAELRPRPEGRPVGWRKSAGK